MTLMPSLAETARNMGWGPSIVEPKSIEQAETYITNVYSISNGAPVGLAVIGHMMWFAKVLRKSQPDLLPEYLGGLVERAGETTTTCSLGMIYAFKYLEWLYEDALRAAAA